MRVLTLSNLYPPDFIGGYELACSQVVDALLERGHDVKVLTASPRLASSALDPPHVLRRWRLTDEWSPSTIAEHPSLRRDREARSRFVDAFNVHALLELLHSFQPDVVYLHNLVGVGGLGLVGCLQSVKAPWVWQLGDYVPLELCSTRDGVAPGLAAEFSRLVRGRFMVTSRRVVTGCARHGVRLNGQVELFPNWIRGRRPTDPRPPRDGGPLRLVAVGRLDPQKGTDLLLEAAARLRDQGRTGFTLDLYGRAVDGAFAAQARALGLDDFVNFRGVRPHAELVSLYRSYDMLLFPTWPREPFGLVALEAAAGGCVPLMTRDCGVAEWLAHGVHCLKCDRSAEAFAETLAMVMDGRIALGPIARRGEEAAWRDFHIDAAIPRIEATLIEAAEAGAGEARFDAATTAETYRLARLAELLTHRILQEAVPA